MEIVGYRHSPKEDPELKTIKDWQMPNEQGRIRYMEGKQERRFLQKERIEVALKMHKERGELKERLAQASASSAAEVARIMADANIEAQDRVAQRNAAAAVEMAKVLANANVRRCEVIIEFISRHLHCGRHTLEAGGPGQGGPGARGPGAGSSSSV